MTDTMAAGFADNEEMELRFIRDTSDFVATAMAAHAVDYANIEQALDEGGFPEIPPHIMGHLIMSWLDQFISFEPETMVNLDGKKAAVDMAEVLGPDHAQALYRFAVLVTKLA